MPTLETHNGYPLWQYIPNLPAAILFVALFVGVTLLHVLRIGVHRTWFCIPFVIGGFLEIIGHIGRALACNATGELGPYVMQSTLLLLAPIFFAASLYMTLGRVIRTVHGERYSFIPVRWLTPIFVTGDCFSFLIQASGAGLLIKAGSGLSAGQNPSLGQNIIVGGLILQLVLFGIFVLVGIVFHARYPGYQKLEIPEVPWQRALNILYLTSAGIIIRNVFRVVQYVQGPAGYTLRNEWCTYVFDALLMFVTMMLFWRYHPGRIGFISIPKSQESIVEIALSENR